MVAKSHGLNQYQVVTSEGSGRVNGKIALGNETGRSSLVPVGPRIAIERGRCDWRSRFAGYWPVFGDFGVRLGCGAAGSCVGRDFGGSEIDMVADVTFDHCKTIGTHLRDA
jgi:hypothetical protein